MIAALFCAATAAGAEAEADMRLPRSIIPTAMALDLVVPDPNTLALQYSGDVAFQLTIAAETNTLTLHSHLLSWTASNCT